MNLKHRSVFYSGLFVWAALLTWPLAVTAQQATPAQKSDPAKPSSPDPDKTDPTVTLSPFDVQTDKDKGYAAANSISGSRINTALKDLPIPIHVITSEFIEDIGATDLRRSLSYVAGITLQSQNDLENA